MKKGYGAKFLCFMLALIMAIPLFSFNAAAIPGSGMPRFNRPRAEKYRKQVAEVTINDMKFTGTLYNTDLTEEEFEKIIRQAMKDLNMDEAEFIDLNKKVDKMLENMNLSEADMKRIRDNIFDIAGAVPGVGTAASVIQILVQLIEGDTSAASKSLLETLGGPAVSMGKAGKTIANEWTRDQKKYREMREGLEATRRLNNFYARIDYLIQDFCDKNCKKNVLEVNSTGATAKKPFTLYGSQDSETWTLSMTLRYKRKLTSNPHIGDGHFAGIYEGDFTIDIEYGVGQLPHRIREMGDVGQRFKQYVDKALGKELSIDVVSGSTWTRRITGKAEATVDVSGGKNKIEFKKQGDQKGGESLVADYFVDTQVGDTYVSMNIRVGFSPGDESIKLDGYETATAITPDIGFTGNKTAMGSVPIEGDIWKRGDTLSPATLKIPPRK